VDDVAAFRRPLGVAAINLSAALDRNDLWVFESSDSEKANCLWDTPGAPFWRPVTSDNQRAADIFARLPRIIAGCGLDGGCKIASFKQEKSDVRASADESTVQPLCASNACDKSRQKLAASIQCVPPARLGHAAALELSIRAHFAGGTSVTPVDRIRPPEGGICADAATFAEPIMDDRRRNSLFVTLVSGSFSQDSKLAARSVEVRAHLISDAGKTLPNIARGCLRHVGHCQFRSSTHYHVNRPMWEECFRVTLPMDDLRKYHLLFSFAHCGCKLPRDIFAFAFLPLACEEARGAVLTSTAKWVDGEGREENEASPIVDGAHKLACFEPFEHDSPILTAMTEPLPSSVSMGRGVKAMDKRMPSYLQRGAARQRGRRMSAGGAAVALGGALRAPRRGDVLFSTASTRSGAVAQAAAAAGGEREWLAIETTLVSECSASAYTPELQKLLRWKQLSPGQETVRAIHAAASADALVDDSRLWPSRFTYGLHALLDIFLTERAPGEPAAAFRTLATTLANFAIRPGRAHIHRVSLRRALAADISSFLPGLRPPTLESEVPTSPLHESPPPPMHTSRVSHHGTPSDDNKQRTPSPMVEIWIPSSSRTAEQTAIDAIPREVELLTRPGVSRELSLKGSSSYTEEGVAEHEWNRFLEISAARELSSQPSLAPSNTPAQPELHVSLLTAVAAPLQWLDVLGADWDDDGTGEEQRRSALTETVASLDALFAICCASYVRSGGASREKPDHTAPLMLDLVDEVFRLVCRMFLKTDRLAWISHAQQLSVRALAGTLEALQGCFPLATTAERAILLIDAIPSQFNEFSIDAAIGELVFLRDISRMPLVCHLRQGRQALALKIGMAVIDILKRANAARIGCVTSDNLVLCWGLGAQAISELISTANGEINDASMLATVFLPGWLTEVASTAFMEWYTDQVDAGPRYETSSYRSSSSFHVDAEVIGAEEQPPFGGLQRDSFQDCTMATLAMLRVGGIADNPRVINAELRACRALMAQPFSLAWPVLNACTSLACSQVLDKAATVVSSSGPQGGADSADPMTADSGHFFSLGLALLHSPGTDVTCMSDIKLGYVLTASGLRFAHMRISAIATLDAAWKRLGAGHVADKDYICVVAHHHANLGVTVVQHAVHLLSSTSGAIQALAIRLLADVAVAELQSRLGDLQRFDGHLSVGNKTTASTLAYVLSATVAEHIDSEIPHHFWHPIPRHDIPGEAAGALCLLRDSFRRLISPSPGVTAVLSLLDGVPACRRMEGVMQAAAEFGETEERMVVDLNILAEVFAAPLRLWGSQIDAGVAVVDGVDGAEVSSAAQRLFGPLDDIVAFASRFAAALRAAEQSGDWRGCFEAHELELVRCYGCYVASYTVAWDDLAALRAKSKTVEAFLKCCELQPANTRRLTLASLTILPVQRAPRYVLLLSELRRRLGEQSGVCCRGWSGNDASALAAAEACARRVATAVNDHALP